MLQKPGLSPEDKMRIVQQSGSGTSVWGRELLDVVEKYKRRSASLLETWMKVYMLIEISTPLSFLEEEATCSKEG